MKDPFISTNDDDDNSINSLFSYVLNSSANDQLQSVRIQTTAIRQQRTKQENNNKRNNKNNKKWIS
jgi:hypothetical protein